MTANPRHERSEVAETEGSVRTQGLVSQIVAQSYPRRVIPELWTLGFYIIS